MFVAVVVGLILSSVGEVAGAQEGSGSASIGHAGGTVTSADAKVTLPFGWARSVPRRPFRSSSWLLRHGRAGLPKYPAGEVYDLEPNGLTVAAPMSVTLQAPMAIRGSKVVLAVVLTRSSEGVVAGRSNHSVTVDTSRHVVTAKGTTSHSSTVELITGVVSAQLVPDSVSTSVGTCDTPLPSSPTSGTATSDSTTTSSR